MIPSYFAYPARQQQSYFPTNVSAAEDPAEQTEPVVSGSLDVEIPFMKIPLSAPELSQVHKS
jgi:hypothetical protein